jgi:hypothetical protein
MCDDLGKRLGQLMGKRSVIGHQDLCRTGKSGSCLGDRANLVSGDQ